MHVKHYTGELEQSHQTKSDREKSNFANKICQHWIKHNLTLRWLEDLMQLFNEKPDTVGRFPTNKTQILKMMKNADCIDPIYYTCCKKCKTYSENLSIRNDQRNCSNCKTELRASETNYFVYLPISNQIKRSIINNWKYIETQIEDTDDEKITDVHDSEILKNIEKHFENTDSTVYSLALNFDGANRFKSNTLSIWPIQLVQNLLPPSIRYNRENIIIAGLYYSNKKPDCLEYFLPLVNELKRLANENIGINVGEKHLKILPLITHCIVDLPAKSHLQQITQYNGKNACTYCLHPSCQVKANKQTYTRYTVGNQEHELRTHAETIQQMLKAEKTQKRINGVKGDSSQCREAYVPIAIFVSA